MAFFLVRSLGLSLRTHAPASQAMSIHQPVKSVAALKEGTLGPKLERVIAKDRCPANRSKLLSWTFPRQRRSGLEVTPPLTLEDGLC